MAKIRCEAVQRIVEENKIRTGIAMPTRSAARCLQFGVDRIFQDDFCVLNGCEVFIIKLQTFKPLQEFGLSLFT
ncbi:MAG: hypothetical protein JO313_10890 [Verrucomicrobia bacterium]|nr:hypothetical protein [Verrucomicrobiota bacterium]MBV9642260.1 hypothetical protein [Verrucomicrobiota bacterium]